jgi:hypothetical protein
MLQFQLFYFALYVASENACNVAWKVPLSLEQTVLNIHIRVGSQLKRTAPETNGASKFWRNIVVSRSEALHNRIENVFWCIKPTHASSVSTVHPSKQPDSTARGDSITNRK